MLSVVMLNVAFSYSYAECCYAECHFDECRYAECRYAECRGTAAEQAGSPRRRAGYRCLQV
jgi:hypothetical protein